MYITIGCDPSRTCRYSKIKCQVFGDSCLNLRKDLLGDESKFPVKLIHLCTWTKNIVRKRKNPPLQLRSDGLFLVAIRFYPLLC